MIYISWRLALCLGVFLQRASWRVSAEPDPLSKVSITVVPEYVTQIACVQNCLWHKNYYDDLIVTLGCPSDWLNGCYCRPGAAASASSFLDTCISQNCTHVSTPTAEYTVAVSVYEKYCAGEATAPLITSSSSSATGTGLASTREPHNPGATPSSTPSPTTPPTPVTSTAPKEGLSTSDTIALAVGIPTGVLSLLAFYFAWKKNLMEQLKNHVSGKPADSAAV
ncbi:hypothetical protein B0T25DRAFT_60162 [Lasiosphaeria hispida]|uniref:Extracellular membrane protein CFEM domain-containing protein n=1 Tax=Lasiosphaeria hispida TaxID=260671 RepID=A0AAJ0MKV4_9PEZI|nr:hypothetical protein B0T25DRAFT_60162 [Lasiosphaeria hispida]